MSGRVLVTGCSSGIGYAVVEALLADGREVIGVSRTRPLLLHDRFHWTCVDIADADEVDGLGASIGDDPLDALVHCAAIRGAIGPVEQSDPRDWLMTLNTNLFGAYNMVRVALPGLRQSNDARVLLFAGGGAFDPHANFSAYSCTKAGVVRLAETLAVELADTTVAVNCVAPGFIATPIHQAVLEAGPELAGAEYRQVVEGMVNDDGTRLARAVACVRHLLSPAARGLTGKTVAAQFDDWERIGPDTMAALMANDLWTGRRVNDHAWEWPGIGTSAPQAPRPDVSAAPVAPLDERRENRPWTPGYRRRAGTAQQVRRFGKRLGYQSDGAS